MSRILLKTTLPYSSDDWHIRRFSLLYLQLSALTEHWGTPCFEVLAHDRREDRQGNDQDLRTLLAQNIEQLWLFLVDGGKALSTSDWQAIETFRQQGGACCFAGGACVKDSGLSKLAFVGAATVAANANATCSSGADGDYQTIRTAQPPHPIARLAARQPLRHLPAHPQECVLQLPPHSEDYAQVIAQGTCQSSQTPFNLALAFDSVVDIQGCTRGRTVLDGSFQRFCDYNLDPDFGCPSFVTGTSGRSMLSHPSAREEANTYFCNIALWLAGTL